MTKVSDNCETSAAENSRCELCGQPAPNVDLRLDARGNGSALKALICSDCALDLELRMDEDTAERSVEELKEQLQENARNLAEGETVTLEEALDNRTENPDELLDADDLDVDASDVEISFPEDGLEPAAWLVKCECDDQWTHLIDNPENLPYVPDYCPDCESRLQSEPLVRLSDVRELLDEMQRKVNQDLEEDDEIGHDFRMAGIAAMDILNSYIKQRLPKFTQNGGSE